jgi:GTP pyrophosphokinase
MVKQVLDKLKSYTNKFDEKRVKIALDLVRKNDSTAFDEHGASLDMIESLIPLRPDESTIIAALLHKIHAAGLVDDALVEEVFGIEILEILIGVKNLESLSYVENDKAVQVENLRKMILAMARDIRVILVTLACRLYKMRNLASLVEKSGRKVYSEETLTIYVPVCARLGMYRFKSELEDYSFKHLNPEEYKNISGQIEGLRKSCNLSISFIKEKLEKFLKEKNIEAEIFGRIKNVYSIYRKLKSKDFNSINEIHDIFAIRMILPHKPDKDGQEMTDHLYALLGLIHSEWKPISRKFRDYLAVSKPNGYRSLHTVVLGIIPQDLDCPVEIQIRDEEMHREAEYGIASHWLYKDAGVKRGYDLQAQIDLIRGLEGIRSELDLDYDVIKEVEIDIFKDRIFVLTPKGEVKDLQKGSNPIDFAYLIHTDIGNRCYMAKVNGKPAPLDYNLQNNDVVEIVTRKGATPKIKWLSMAKTTFARNKIKAWLNANVK